MLVSSATFMALHLHQNLSKQQAVVYVKPCRHDSHRTWLTVSKMVGHRVEKVATALASMTMNGTAKLGLGNSNSSQEGIASQFFEII